MGQVGLSNYSRQGLCARCRAIDLDAAFIPHRPRFWGRTIANLGNLSSRLKESNCPLCRLFHSMRVEVPWMDVYYPKPESKDEHHLRAFVLGELSSPGRHIHGSKEGQVLLGVAPGQGSDYFPPECMHDCNAAGFVSRVPSSQSPDPSDYTHTVDPTLANLDRLRDWLQHCTSNHRGTCVERASKAAVSLKVVDCQTHTVVPLGDKDDYFALSYIWGAPAAKETSTVPSKDLTLPSPLSQVPKVIRDAITVVVGLGGRYLWVDKYCISQTASAEKDEPMTIKVVVTPQG